MSDPLVPSLEAITPSATVNRADSVMDSSAPLAGFLGVSEPDKDARTQLEFISKELPNEGPGDLMMQVREIERRIGPAKLGESRLGRIYGYMRLLSQSKTLTKQMQRIENGQDS